jgi:hypothetical protein
MKKNFILAFLFLSSFLFSQKDSTMPALAAPLIGVHLGGDLPFADLGKRYGPNLNMGFNFMYKTKRNWLFGLDANYGFGRNIKEDVLAQMKNSDGFFVDNEGYPADLRISERIITTVLHCGKLLPLGSPNPNSGLLVDAGVGYMQHKIHFVDINKRVAAVNGDIRNGFDLLSNGICLSQFIGYMFLSDNRYLNFYTGVEVYEGITTSVRKWNYATGERDTKTRTDILLGLRIGWILPLYNRTPKNYFYN